ncbi:MAG: hypothetical protein KIS78_00020 [Labilithrix sp.]|nr:hypothetical protein [Labilithrix sp.]MCW5830824.1 hypothetical protein [Labilithrix sp.]
MRRGEDEGLRLLALGRLGPLASPLAREALEHGVTEVEPNVLAWTGTMGMVHGHLVVLWLEPDLHARVTEVPSVVDALTAAVASAVARVSGNALAELKILARAARAARSTPYRGRI